MLRVALFGEFFGHGVFALMVHPPFVELLTGATGLPVSAAPSVLRIIGAIDILIAIAALVWPARPILVYAAMWGLLTGLARPASGKPVYDFIERWPNWGVPAALYLVRTRPQGEPDPDEKPA